MDYRVSIHALLAECDGAVTAGISVFNCFNPRTPCGVRQLIIVCQPAVNVVSIHALLAECDFGRYSSPSFTLSFNPRTPCGVRLIDKGGFKDTERFQSTHSLRSATGHEGSTGKAWNVSIHALLAECDSGWVSACSGCKCFNPRTPCGVRQVTNPQTGVKLWFQSTHSLRSATVELTPMH